MTRVLSIVVSLSIAAIAVPAGHASSDPVERIIAQENAKGLVVQPASPSPVKLIIAQERARHADPRLFGPSGLAPVQVVGPSGGFDWGDAGIGSAATVALTLLAAGGMTLRTNGRRRRAHV